MALLILNQSVPLFYSVFLFCRTGTLFFRTFGTVTAIKLAPSSYHVTVHPRINCWISNSGFETHTGRKETEFLILIQSLSECLLEKSPHETVLCQHCCSEDDFHTGSTASPFGRAVLLLEMRAQKIRFNSWIRIGCPRLLGWMDGLWYILLYFVSVALSLFLPLSQGWKSCSKLYTTCTTLCITDVHVGTAVIAIRKGPNCRWNARNDYFYFHRAA